MLKLEEATATDNTHPHFDEEKEERLNYDCLRINLQTNSWYHKGCFGRTELWTDDGAASKTFTEKEFFIMRYINKINIFSLFKIRTKKHSEKKLTHIYGNKCVCSIVNFFLKDIFFRVSPWTTWHLDTFIEILHPARRVLREKNESG